MSKILLQTISSDLYGSDPRTAINQLAKSLVAIGHFEERHGTALHYRQIDWFLGEVTCESDEIETLFRLAFNEIISEKTASM